MGRVGFVTGASNTQNLKDLGVHRSSDCSEDGRQVVDLNYSLPDEDCK